MTCDMKKTTGAQFRLFKKACLLWQKRLGLSQYRLYFERGISEDSNDYYVYANIDVNEMGKVATVRLCSAYPKDDDFDVERTAKHEMCHLMTSRLRWLGNNRYICSSDLIEEDESIVRRLEGLLYEREVIWASLAEN